MNESRDLTRLATVDLQTFRNALARWASGVTIVTTIYEGKRVGITASSFSSLSAQPPLILVCVNRKLYTNEAIHNAGFFAVNILDTQQLEWGMRFAGMTPEIEDRFAGIDFFEAETGAPLLPESLGWLDCRVHLEVDVGEHTIFIGEVVAASGGEGDPLLYFNRAWRKLDSEPVTRPQ